MDPNEALRQLREISAAVLSKPEGAELALLELAGIFQGLDFWIIRGGFLPADWGTVPAPIQ